MFESYDDKISMFFDFEFFDLKQEEYEEIVRIVPILPYLSEYDDGEGYIRYWFVEELENATLPVKVYADSYLRLLPPYFASNSSLLRSIISKYPVKIAIYCHGDHSITQDDALFLPIPTFHVNNNALSYIKEYNASISFIPLYFLEEKTKEA